MTDPKYLLKTTTFKGYEVNPYYSLRKSSLETIHSSMFWSLKNISKPRAMHITIGLTDKDTFSIEKFNRRLKAKFKDEGLVHLYSFELSDNDNHHLHCMFIYNAEVHRSYYTVYKMIYECAMLDGVRKEELLIERTS
ncbi:hypothetical protein A0120_RS15785 [Acinetobacter baumannii]|uniref:hypothetical protein n=1 Tax=Acinetobacter pittii TaxID=48296 RepID=UPI001DDE543C|nr:hypothetical protein [Acinetobacter baumannii]